MSWLLATTVHRKLFSCWVFRRWTPSSTPCFPAGGGARFGCTPARVTLAKRFLPLQEWRRLRCRAARGGLCVRRVSPVWQTHQLSTEVAHHAPPWPLLALPVHHLTSKMMFFGSPFLLGSSWLSLPVPQPSETEHSPKKPMSSSEPILDLKTDTTEALPGEKHASLQSQQSHHAEPCTGCLDGPALSNRHLTGTRVPASPTSQAPPLSAVSQRSLIVSQHIFHAELLPEISFPLQRADEKLNHISGVEAVSPFQEQDDKASLITRSHTSTLDLLLRSCQTASAAA